MFKKFGQSLLKIFPTIFQDVSRIPRKSLKNFRIIISKFPRNLFSWFYNIYVSLEFLENYFRISPNFSKIPPDFFHNFLPLFFFKCLRNNYFAVLACSFIKIFYFRLLQSCSKIRILKIWENVSKMSPEFF